MRRHFHFLLGPIWVSALAFLAGLFAGCQTPAYDDPARQGPFFTPTNHAGDATLPPGLRRVVLLPLSGGAVASPETVAALDAVFISALQRQNRFEVVTLSREECRRRFHVDALGSTEALPHDFLAMLRREFAADAVLFVDLTVFHGYRPLAFGLRAKLATLDGVRLIWTFDNVFAADNPAVANSARRHFLEQNPGRVPADLTHGVLQSPSHFATYAAAAMFATLPPVVPPAPPAEPAAAATNRP